MASFPTFRGLLSVTRSASKTVSAPSPAATWTQQRCNSNDVTVKKKRDAARYSINYQTLKDDALVGTSGTKAADLVGKARPSTVTSNLKNVSGFKGGAERGFLAVYPDCIHKIVSEVGSDSGLKDWTTKVLTHNLSTNVLGHTRFGLITPIAFYQLSSSGQNMAAPTKESMKDAHIVGWCVELNRAAEIMASDTLRFRGHRNILSRVTVEPASTWADKHDLGSKAFNDALLLQSGAQVLLRGQISAHASYGHILDAFGQVQSMAASGRALALRIAGLPSQGAKMQALNVTAYKRIVYSNLTFPRYVLPVRLALHLAGLNGTRVLDQAQKVLSDIGFLTQMTGDFGDCYYDATGSGTDIEDGRMTWLVVNAYHRGNAAQKAALEDNYGVDDPAKVAIVRQVFDDLKLKKMVGRDIDQHREEMMGNIQQISALSKDTLSSRFFFQLLDNISNMA